MLKAAILGASGYAGNELLRLLLAHPEVTVTAATSERYAGSSISDIFLNFRDCDLSFEEMNFSKLKDRADIFFLCLPHKTSQEAVAYFHKAGKKVVDLSADYRLKNAKVYSRWYDTPHLFKPLIKKAVYGLPEIYREKIRDASIIANPGCYPTSAILGLAPLMGTGIIKKDSIVIDSKSGTSGAGRNPSQPLMYCEVNDSVRAYSVGVHRHTPEIEQELSALSGEKIDVVFTPHLIPMDRGIFSTIYLKLDKKTTLSSVQKIYKDYYRNEPFVRILKNGAYPATKAVKGTNFCDISVFMDKHSGGGNSLVIVSAIDNLLKGASGAAVQNMNVMYGFDEATGLTSSPPSP